MSKASRNTSRLHKDCFLSCLQLRKIENQGASQCIMFTVKVKDFLANDFSRIFCKHVFLPRIAQSKREAAPKKASAKAKGSAKSGAKK